MPRIEEWKNRGEIKNLWRYVITFFAISLSLPIAFATLFAVITITLGITFGEQSVAEAVRESGVLIRFIHLVNFGLMIMYYYFVVRFTRGIVFTYKHWVLVGLTSMPFFYYIFTGI